MGTVTETPRQRKPLAPVHGRVRWLRRPAGLEGIGRLAITNGKGQTTEYDVAAVVEGGKLVGFVLAKDDDERHEVDCSFDPADARHWTCTCPDFSFNSRYRPSGEQACKHIKSIEKSYRVLGLLPAAAVKSAVACELDDL